MRNFTFFVLLVLLAFAIFYPSLNNVQVEALQAQAGNTPPSIGENGQVFGPQKTVQELYMSIGVLVFGLVVIIAEVYLFNRTKGDIDTAFKYFVVTLIIIGSLFLVTAGYGNEQIAPILGLMGTIAGYLLGKFDNSSRKNTTSGS
ncbi:MAG: hypothetical protein AAFO07_29745 [Bacteroidota bacterium]